MPCKAIKCGNEVSNTKNQGVTDFFNHFEIVLFHSMKTQQRKLKDSVHIHIFALYSVDF